MQEFSTNVDIGARACQLCGDFRLYSFQDASPQAREISFAYDKLRLSELQRVIWKFATRRAVLRPVDTASMLFIPAAWSATSIYMPGSVVSYDYMIFVSQGWPAVGDAPDAPPIWTPYFGPMTITPWDDGVRYFAGELVYYPAAETYTIYLSLQSGNTDTPGAFPDWASTTIYNRGDTVMYPGRPLFSVPGNIPVFSTGGIRVSSAPTGPWQSLRDLNANVIPGADAQSWATLPITDQVHNRTGQKWLKLDSTLESINIVYPIGTGPSADLNTRNVYKLPNGYLKHAPDISNPNQILQVMGIVSDPPSDMQIENGYMVTSEVRAVMLRFVADMTDVTQMDDLFCEGLAARIALDVGPVILSKEDRRETLARVSRRYKDAILDARANDAVERGASAQPQSQYVSVRL